MDITSNVAYSTKIIMSSPAWSVFVMALPNQNNTLRMRVWRHLKTRGAAVLRDGVYLLPFEEGLHTYLLEQQTEINNMKGSSWVLDLPPQKEEQTAAFQSLFNRNEDYAQFLKQVDILKQELKNIEETDVRRQFRQLQRDLNALIAIDYFPNQIQILAKQQLFQLEQLVNQHFSPQEPGPNLQILYPLNKADFQQQLWVTRSRPWIDRLASAWLIQRFIDSHAQFLWLDNLNDAPPHAIGFDFEGAAFTHTEQQVTFEVLYLRFELTQDWALKKIANLVHYLDVGGNYVPEAAGIEKILAGMRRQASNDDELLTESVRLFNQLYLAESEINNSQ